MRTPSDAEQSTPALTPHAPSLPRLTRREVLEAGVATAAGAALALSGCAPSTRIATPTPIPFALNRPATVYADNTIPAPLAATLIARIGGNSSKSGVPSATPVTSLSAAPDFILTYGRLPSGYVSAAIGASPVTVAAHLRVPLDTVTSAQATDLLSGRVTDWRVVGSPYSLPVHLLALAGLPAPKQITYPTSMQTQPTMAALLQALQSHPGAIALMPLEAADWSVRNLGVDNIYPAQGRGDLTAAPYAAYTLQLGVAQPLATRGLDGHALAKDLVPALATQSAVLDLAAVGDIMLGRTVNQRMVAYKDYLYPFRKIRDEFQSAHLRVANLECTITDLVAPPSDPLTFDFITAKRAIDGLTYAGLSAVTVANNHAGGAGVNTLLDMLSTLHAHSIGSTGGGPTLAEARQPAVISAQGQRIALLGYDAILPQCPYADTNTPGLAPLDLATLPQDLRAARAQADLVIPYFHWGIEYTKDPTLAQQTAAHAAIDAGADMVLGVHPHWVQGIESYKGRLIIYSLGNCVFDQNWSRPTMEGMLLHLYWRGGALASIRFVPLLDEDQSQPRVMSPAEAVGVFERMWSGSDMLAAGQHGPEPEP